MLLYYISFASGFLGFIYGSSMMFTAIFHGYRKASVDTYYMLWGIMAVCGGLFGIFTALNEFGVFPR